MGFLEIHIFSESKCFKLGLKKQNKNIHEICSNMLLSAGLQAASHRTAAALTKIIDGHDDLQAVTHSSVLTVGADRHHLDHVACVCHQVVQDGTLMDRDYIVIFLHTVYQISVLSVCFLVRTTSWSPSVRYSVEVGLSAFASQ